MKKQNLSVMDGSVSDEKKFCILHSTFCLSGFTLIEILVALVIVAVTVSVVLSSQLHTLKIEQHARVLQLFRFETQRLFSATHRAKNEAQLVQFLTTGSLCRVKSEPVKIESGTNILILIKHELNADQLPSSSLRSQGLYSGGVGFSSVFYTRFPDYPGQRMNATADSAKEQKSPVSP